MTPPPLAVEWLVQTPEKVSFRFRPAGPAPRLFALIIDLVLMVVALYLVAVVAALIGELGFGLWLLAFFLLWWFYGALFEALWNGRTPGKALLRLRVIGHDGAPATPAACVLRNLLTAADWLPAGFAAALLSMTLSRGYRRLGDLAAGTIVVHDERPSARGVEPVLDEPVLGLAARLPAGLGGLLGMDALRSVGEYVARRQRFHPSRREEMARHLAGPLAALFDLPRETPADQLLCAVHLRAQHPELDPEEPPARRRSAPAKAPAPGGVAIAKKQRWRRLEELLALPERRLGARQAVELAALHRAAGADLAQAGSRMLGAEIVAYLEHLVAAAHLRLYRRKRAGWRRFLQLLLEEAPRRLYRDNCLRIAGAAFALSFFGCWLIGAGDPDAAVAFLGEETIAGLEAMYHHAPRDRSAEDAAQMIGFYINNNVGIALRSFATGIFIGIGSLLTLLFNGIYLGLVFGYMSGVREPLREHFMEFVTAHGPFELTGIVLAGAAGLRLGWGLVDTGGLTRMASLHRSARQAVPVIAAAGVLVGLAAFVEAYISPSSLPRAVKIGTAVACALLLIGYLGVLGAVQGRRAGGDDGDETET